MRRQDLFGRWIIVAVISILDALLFVPRTPLGWHLVSMCQSQPYPLDSSTQKLEWR